MDLIADTSFLVGLWRRQSWALEFAQQNPGKVMGIPWVVRGEFWHGALRAGHHPADVERFLSLGLSLDDAGPVIPTYARLAARLQESHPATYREIGQNDLWIAASAVQAGLPLLTRNERHFGKIDGLTVCALVC